MSKLIILFVLFFISVTSFPSEEGKKFADKINSDFKSTGERANTNEMPWYQGTDVPVKKYYAPDIKIEEAVRTDTTKEQQEQIDYVTQATNRHQKVRVDRNKDPLFKRYDEIQTEAQSLTGTYDESTKTYTGCKRLPVGTNDITKYDKKTCLEYGRRDPIVFSCEKRLDVNCNNSDAGLDVPFNIDEFVVSGSPWNKVSYGIITHFGPSRNDRNGRCTSYQNKITFYVGDVKQVSSFRIETFSFDDWVTISINGHVMYTETMNRAYNRIGCERGQVFTKTGFDLKPYLQNGVNTIEILNIVGGGGGVWFDLRATKRPACQERNDYSYSCNNGRNYQNANLVASNCVEVGSTRNIHGTQVSRSCWRWQETYSGLSDPFFSKEDLCGELVKNGCGLTTVNCLEQATDGQYCKKTVYNYSCPTQVAARYVDLCAKELKCANGNCTTEYQVQNNATEDFKKTASTLQSLQELADVIKTKQISIFKGKNLECKEHILGAANCCKESGWGIDLGISNCSSDEKELGMAREAGRTISIGKYKKGSIIDKRTYNVFCSYQSKLARIIIHQGKAQLGKGFGDAEHPDCSGISTDELQQINFDKIDFSEFYKEVMDKVDPSKSPDISLVVAKIKSELTRGEGAEKYSGKKRK